MARRGLKNKVNLKCFLFCFYVKIKSLLNKKVEQVQHYFKFGFNIKFFTGTTLSRSGLTQAAITQVGRNLVIQHTKNDLLVNCERI